MGDGRSNQAPAKEDTAKMPWGEFTPNLANRQEIDKEVSDRMREDFTETPDDFTMPDIPVRPQAPGSEQE